MSFGAGPSAVVLKKIRARIVIQASLNQPLGQI